MRKRKFEAKSTFQSETINSKTFGLSESILMDFVEAVVETNIPAWLVHSLNQFFLGNEKVDEKIVSETIDLMKNTFLRFFGKTMYFKSLTNNDQRDLS